MGKIIQEHHKNGRFIAAICAAPIALKSHGIATGCALTSHPVVEKALVDAGYFLPLSFLFFDFNI